MIFFIIIASKTTLSIKCSNSECCILKMLCWLSLGSVLIGCVTGSSTWAISDFKNRVGAISSQYHQPICAMHKGSSIKKMAQKKPLCFTNISTKTLLSVYVYDNDWLSIYTSMNHSLLFLKLSKVHAQFFRHPV